MNVVHCAKLFIYGQDLPTNETLELNGYLNYTRHQDYLEIDEWYYDKENGPRHTIQISMKLLEMTPLKPDEDWEIYLRNSDNNPDVLIETKEQGQRHVNEESMLVMKVSEQINSSKATKATKASLEEPQQEMIPLSDDESEKMPVRKRQNNRSRRNSLRRKQIAAGEDQSSEYNEIVKPKIDVKMKSSQPSSKHKIAKSPPKQVRKFSPMKSRRQRKLEDTKLFKQSKKCAEKASSKKVTFSEKLVSNGEKEQDESSLTQSEVSIQKINDSINQLEKNEQTQSSNECEIQILIDKEVHKQHRSSIISSEMFNQEIRKLRQDEVLSDSGEFVQYTNKAGGKYLLDIEANKLLRNDFISKRIYKSSVELKNKITEMNKLHSGTSIQYKLQFAKKYAQVRCMNCEFFQHWYKNKDNIDIINIKKGRPINAQYYRQINQNHDYAKHKDIQV